MLMLFGCALSLTAAKAVL